MKSWILVLVATLLITSCFTQPEMPKKKKKIKDSIIRYITNWDLYKIPVPVAVTALKDILEKVALYNQQFYCPLEDGACFTKKDDLTAIMQKIIKDSVAEFGAAQVEMIDVPQVQAINVTGQQTDLSTAAKPEMTKKSELRTFYFDSSLETDFKDDVVSRIIQFGESINNRPLSSAIKTLELVIIDLSLQ